MANAALGNVRAHAKLAEAAAHGSAHIVKRPRRQWLALGLRNAKIERG
jgi:hypothetical protein